MSTLLQLRDRTRKRLGDNNKITWPDGDIEDALAQAIEDSWPHFYLPVYDETSFTGVNALAANTTEIAIPTAFLSQAGQSYRDGAIFYIEARMTNGTETAPIYKPWFPVTKGVVIDNTSLYNSTRTPTIEFTDPYFQQGQKEIRLSGGRPLTPPPRWYFNAATDDTIQIVSPIDAYSQGSPTNSYQGFTNGYQASVSDLAGATGLAINTNYFVVNAASPGSTQCKLSLTSGGTAVDITTVGTGTIMLVNIGTGTLQGGITEGFNSYLIAAASDILHSSRQKSQQYDRRAHSQRSLRADQLADKLRSRYRMTRPNFTLYPTKGGG